MSSKLKDLPASERPRERLLHHGVDALSLSELIAILLGTGTKELSVLPLAQSLVSHFETLPALLEASVAELTTFKGIGLTKAIQLKAAFGIALKCLQRQEPARPLILTPADAATIAKPLFHGERREVLVVLLKDIKQRLIHLEKIAVGTLSEVLSHPREVFYPAIKHRAHSLVLLHNHPSNDPTPSNADLKLTRELLLAARLLHIPLDDHIVVAGDAFTSLVEENGSLRHTSPRI